MLNMIYLIKYISVFVFLNVFNCSLLLCIFCCQLTLSVLLLSLQLLMCARINGLFKECSDRCVFIKMTISWYENLRFLQSDFKQKKKKKLHKLLPLIYTFTSSASLDTCSLLRANSPPLADMKWIWLLHARAAPPPPPPPPNRVAAHRAVNRW